LNKTIGKEHKGKIDTFAKSPVCHPDQQGGIFQLTVKARFLPLVGMTKVVVSEFLRVHQN